MYIIIIIPMNTKVELMQIQTPYCYFHKATLLNDSVWKKDYE